MVASYLEYGEGTIWKKVYRTGTTRNLNSPISVSVALTLFRGPSEFPFNLGSPTLDKASKILFFWKWSPPTCLTLKQKLI